MDRKLLSVVLVLKEHSNENTFLTQKDIVNFLNTDEYGGYKYDRRSISSALKLIVYDENIDKRGVFADKLEQLFLIRVIRGKIKNNGKIMRGVALINIKKK